MNTIKQATDYAKTLPFIGEGKCLTFVSNCYDPPASTYSDTAADSFAKVPAADIHQGTAPLGAILYWTGGTPRLVNGVMKRAGHITISLGGGLMVSTDWGDDGFHGDGRTRICHVDCVSKFDNPSYPLVLQGWTFNFAGAQIVQPSEEEEMFIRIKAADGTLSGVYYFLGTCLAPLSGMVYQELGSPPAKVVSIASNTARLPKINLVAGLPSAPHTHPVSASTGPNT